MTDIESLTASLVREYLSRKGLKRTLQVLDQELPRLEHSISNRAILAKEVRIEKLIKKNKEQALVFRTMLEVIVHYLRERGAASATPSSTLSSTSTPSTQELQRPTTAATRERKSSTEKFKVPLPKSSELEDPDMSKEDYSDLLKRLEKSEQPIKTRDVLHTNTPISLTQKPHYSSHSDNTVTPSPTPRAKTPRAKTARTRARTAGLGGPVVSSGLAGGREKRGLHVKSYSSDLSVTGHNFHTDRTKGTDDNGLRASNWEKLDYDSTIVTEKESLDDSTKSVKNIIQVDLQNNLLGTETKQNKSSRPMSSLSKKSNYQPQLQRKDELVFEDIDDDLDESLSSLSLGSSQQIEADFESKPISLEQAMALKNLIFGSAKSSFNQEWRQQSFNFCDIYGLEYGIVQHKGGPCGVLAAVQSFVLKSLLFGDQRKSDPKHPTSRERTKALATAITEILWRAGQGQSAVVALPTGFGNSNFIGAGRYKPDQLTENLVLRTFSSQQSLHSYVYQQIRQFEDQSSSGCILLLYSTILSRTIKSVISDMDDPNTKLMGAHGYCTQEMVNLITTGKATSNAFDNTIELDSGGSNVLLLKGLEKQADVGLLSLFEHYESCQVGNYYKTPKYPIWVICSESHFSVMFSTDRILLENWDHKEKFDVYYYDGLSRQEEEIRLTIDTSKECPESKDGDLVPPLEHVIRTRWKKASVDWNGSEPIL